MSMASCVYNNGIPMEVTSSINISLDTSELELKVGDGGKTFTPTLSSEEVEIKNNQLSISIKDNKVVSVDKNKVASGEQVRVKALSVGETTITITSLQDTNAKATINVEVVEQSSTVDPTSIELESTSLDLKVDETIKIVEKSIDTDETLYYEVKPIEATNRDVVIETSTPEFVSISEDNVVKALKKGTGKVIVRHKVKDIKAELTINITEDETLTENAIYLVGGGDTYGNWSPIKAMEFKRNEGNTTEEEYMITFTGKAGDEVKAKRFTSTNPDAAENWFEIDSNYAGEFEANAEIYNGNLKLKKNTIYTIYLNVSRKSGNQYKYYVGLGS